MKSAIAWFTLLAAPAAWAGRPCSAASFAIPAIDDIGLVVLAVLVGGVASWVAKRRR